MAVNLSGKLWSRRLDSTAFAGFAQTKFGGLSEPIVGNPELDRVTLAAPYISPDPLEDWDAAVLAL
jgi:hypothetical protein